MRDGGAAVGLWRLPLHLAKVWTPVGDEGLAARVGHICKGGRSVRGFESSRCHDNKSLGMSWVAIQ